MALKCPECGTNLVTVEIQRRKDLSETRSFLCHNPQCGYSSEDEKEWEYTQPKSTPKRKVHYLHPNGGAICGTRSKKGVICTTSERDVTCKRCLHLLTLKDMEVVWEPPKKNNNSSIFLFVLVLLLFAVMAAIAVQQQQIQELKKQIKSKSEIQGIVYESIPEPKTDAMNATITAYTASEDETDDTPNKTALMTEPVPGWTCAVSRDLGAHLHDKVWIEGFGVREVTDFMNKRHEKSIDLCVGNKSIANEIGRSEREVVFYER